MKLKELSPRERRNLAWIGILAAREHQKDLFRHVKRGKVMLKVKKLEGLTRVPQEHIEKSY